MKKNYLVKIGHGLLLSVFLMNFMVVHSQTTASQTFNFTSNGAVQTFTVPFGVTSITAEVWGAGGGGGGGTTTNARGGGGGGAYSRTVISTTSGTVYSLVVGQGGVGTSNPGGTGGTSSFYLGATTYASALGGIGGGGTTGTAGGAGGVGTSGVGTVRFSGGAGGTGTATGAGGGGGGSAGAGSAGGTGGNGAAGTGAAGSGGAAGSATGGTGGATGGAGGTRNNTNAAAGNVPGGGGGGKGSNVNTAAGGTAGNGRVVVTYTINYIDLSVTKTPSTSSPFAGDAVTFTIVAKNNNLTLAASNVVLTDLLPTGYTFISSNQSGYTQSSGVWNIGNLAANTTTTLTITALVNDSGVYNNTATISSDTMPDDVPANNSATATMTVCKGGSTAPQVKQ